MTVVVQYTRIGLDAVFKDEANRQTVAEVFRTLDAPAGAGGHTGFHREFGNRIVIKLVAGVGIADINDRRGHN